MEACVFEFLCSRDASGIQLGRGHHHLLLDAFTEGLFLDLFEFEVPRADAVEAGGEQAAPPHAGERGEAVAYALHHLDGVVEALGCGVGLVVAVPVRDPLAMPL